MISGLGLLSRRHMMRSMSATLVGVGALASGGCARLIPQGLGLALTPSQIADPVVFNFALNLEYLEAEYYARGITGEGLSNDLLGPKPRGVLGGRKVNFATPYIREFMAEIAEDERNHVRFLRQTIKASPLIELSRPAIDLQDSFRAAGAAAGLGDSFDPFADEESFLLGAFIFEDVGVTAYAGAAKRVADGLSIEAAAGILAVEAYHAGIIRAQLAEMGSATVAKANAISAARDRLDGPETTEVPLTDNGRIVISPTDGYGRAYPRTVQQVLNVAYLTPGKDVKRGGFFPEGVNGIVRHSRYDTLDAGRLA